MSKNTDVEVLRTIAHKDYMPASETALLERIAAQLDSDAKRFADSEKLQEIGKSAMSSIADMVAALDCDYERLEELRTERRTALDEKVDLVQYLTVAEQEELHDLETEAGECKDREEAEQRIMEDPLSVQVRTGWYEPSTAGTAHAPEEFELLLGTGGPATRIIGELNEHGEPTRARLQAQDWFQPWTDYVGADMDTLLTYCRCFYFGEG